MILLLTIITPIEREILGSLICSVSKGDKKALSDIYEKVGGRLLSVAMGITRNLSVAEDVLQDSFIKVAQNSHMFRNGTNGYAWLCTVVRNTALNKLKSDNLRKGYDIDSFFNLADGREDISNKDTAILVNDALKQLDSKKRTVIWLKYFNDMTVREIAEELNMAKSTVQDCIKKGEEQLKALLK